MPEHIIDAIFDFIDLASRKSLSETCKRFNSIFSHLRNLNKVWLNFGDQCPLPLLTSSRTHPNLILNKTLPVSILQHLSSSQNLKGLKIEIESFKCSSSQSAELTFIDAISHFTNLKHLEVVSYPHKSFDILLQNPNKDKYPRVELKHLEYLKIDGSLFSILFEYNIQFTSEKLRKIIFGNHPKEKDDQNRMKSFIAKQRDLRALRLEVYSRFFESPPLIVNSKLRQFELKYPMYFGDPSKSESAQNFLKFIESHDKDLEVLTLPDVVFKVVNSPHIKQLRHRLLDLKIKRTLPIEYFSVYRTVPESSLISVDSELDIDVFTGPPNLAVEELKMLVYYGLTLAMPNLFARIARKFPNLKRIDISDWDFPWRFPQLNGSLNISELHIDEFNWLESIMITNLLCLGFEISICSDEEMHSQLQQLLARHETIEKLVIKGISMTPRNDEEIDSLVKLVEFALANLKSLKLILVEELISYRQYKVDKWQVVTIKSIGRLVIKHAQAGFHFCSRGRDSDGLDILKRDDMNVVWQKEGRWKIL